MSHAKTGFVPVLHFRKRQKREVSNLSPESSMAGMETVIVSAEETIEMVSDTLQKRYPSTVFAVRLEDTVEHMDDICGLDVIWIDGPSRERVEDLVDRFQGVNWDPATGALKSRSHYAVTPEGNLVRVVFNVDYIFCDGPMLAVSP